MEYTSTGSVYVKESNSHRAAIGILLIARLVLALFLGYVLLSNGAFAIRGVNPPKIIPPSKDSLTPPPSGNPTGSWMVLWNSCGGGPQSPCSMNNTGWREGGVPDTF